MKYLKIGGTSVPNAAQYPNATPVPSDNPRKRIVNPYVSPPKPHSIPKKYVQKSVLMACCFKTPNRSFVMK